MPSIYLYAAHIQRGQILPNIPAPTIAQARTAIRLAAIPSDVQPRPAVDNPLESVAFTSKLQPSHISSLYVYAWEEISIGGWRSAKSKSFGAATVNRSE